MVARGDARSTSADQPVPGNVGLGGSQPGSFPQVTASDLVLRIGKEMLTFIYGYWGIKEAFVTDKFNSNGIENAEGNIIINLVSDNDTNILDR